MKFIYINFLLFFNLLISANTIESINDFFKNNLEFVQTSFNTINNSFDKSYGNFSRDLNNNIKIEINSPFKEIYFINEDGIEIHDLEFNQKRFIKNQDIPNNILKFIKNGFKNESLDFVQIDDNKFKITEFENNYNFEFLSNDTPDHHHLICIRCGRTEEFENDEVLEAGKVAAKVNGFKLIESSLNVRAICPNCM